MKYIVSNFSDGSGARSLTKVCVENKNERWLAASDGFSPFLVTIRNRYGIL